MTCTMPGVQETRVCCTTCAIATTRGTYPPTSHSVSILEFVTVGYVILAAMFTMGTTDMASLPTDYPEELCGREGKELYMLQLSKHSAQLAMQKPNIDEILGTVPPDNDDYDLCVCKMDIGGPMIYCENRQCPRGEWFHYECVGLAEETVPEGKYYCSQECKQPGKKAKKDTVAEHLLDRKQEYSRALLYYLQHILLPFH